MNAIKSQTIKFLDRILPLTIKRSIFHLAFHLAREEFDMFSFKFGFAPNMEYGLQAMKERGFSPNTIIDIGAFKGSWSKLAKRTWPSSHVIMVEPNLENKESLLQIAKDLDAELFFELLGAQAGNEVQFNVMGTGSSIMAERSALPRVSEMRKLSTLDSLKLNIERPALLKIDAQGYELQILKGASTIFRHLEAVLLEVSIIEINEGAPLIHDVVAYMKMHGFVAYDILELHRRPLDSALNQVDIIFVRDQCQLIADKRHFA